MTNTNRVFVLDKNKKRLMPTRPARARRLLKRGRAIVYRLEPFTIIILDRTYETCEFQNISLKFDPGFETRRIWDLCGDFNDRSKPTHIATALCQAIIIRHEVIFSHQKSHRSKGG